MYSISYPHAQQNVVCASARCGTVSFVDNLKVDYIAASFIEVVTHVTPTPPHATDPIIFLLYIPPPFLYFFLHPSLIILIKLYGFEESVYEILRT